MARAVLAANPMRLATCRAAALSHACPTASSNRLLNGALLGSCSTFSAFTPHCGHRTRYSSSTTVAWYTKPAKPRTSRSSTSQISLTPRPQFEHTTFRLPDLRRTHSFSDDRDKLQDTLNRLRPRPITGSGAQECPDLSYYMAEQAGNKNDPEALRI